jgi:integrase
MSVYRPKGSPYFHFDFQFRGKRHCGSTLQTSRRAAEQFEARERQKASLPTMAKPPITLDEACGLRQDHLEDRPSWPTVRPMLAALLSLGANRLLADIHQIDLMRHFAKRRNGRKDSSVNREIEEARAVWRGAMKARFDVGEMPEWGALLYEIPDQPPRELSWDEEDRLFPEIRADLVDACTMALRSGWRKREVIKLRWADVDFANAEALTRIKGGAVVRRALTNDMLVLIANQPRVGPFVFTYICQANKSRYTDKRGRLQPARQKGERYPLTATVLRKPWAAAKKAAGVDGLRFHDLRHTAGTRIVRATGNIALAKRALEHRSIKSTLRYAHVLNDDVRNGLDAANYRNSPEHAESDGGKMSETLAENRGKSRA